LHICAMRQGLRFVVFVLSLCISTAYSQRLEEIPMLKKGLSRIEPDSARIDRLWRIAFHYSQVLPDSGLPYAQRAMFIAKQKANRRGLAESANIAGLCFSNLGKYAEAEAHFQLALGIFRIIGDPCLTTAVLGNRGWNFYHQHQFTQALAQFFEAEQLDRRCLTRGWKSTSFYNIGVAYNALKAFEKALPYFEQAIRHDLQSGDSTKLATALQGKANALRDLGRIDESRAHYQLALSLYQRLNDRYAEAYVYENMAELELGQGNYSLAAASARKALVIFEKLHRHHDAQYERGLLAKILMRSGNLKEAEVEARKSLYWAVQLNDPFARKEAYAQLSEVYEQGGDFRNALFTRQQENQLRDSLNEVEQAKAQAELAVRYETEKKDRLLERERLRSAEARQAELEARQEKTLWLLGSLVALLLSLLIALRWYQSRKTAISLQKKNEQIAEEKERALRSEKAKELFLSTMSHELRNPLSALQGILRLVNTDKSNDKDRNYVIALRNLSAHMQRVVDDVLDTAQLDAGRLALQETPFKLHETIDGLFDVYTALAAEKGLQFNLSIHFDESLVLLGDQSRILQILHNLLSNALKFTHEGAIELIVSYENNTLTAIVQDQGPGISDDLKPRLFEPFEQAQSIHGSSGLGLAISKRIAALMNGDLIVLTEAEKGARFKMSIPLFEAEPRQRVETESPEKDYAQLEGHILLVEDDPYAFMVTRDTIQKYAPLVMLHHFSSANGVEQELNADEYNLMLLDIHLPGVSGVELCKQLRLQGHTLPIYAFTAAVTSLEVEVYLNCGMTGVVSKPFSDHQLLAVISKHLERGSQASLPSIQQALKPNALLLENYLPHYLNLAQTAWCNQDAESLSRCFHSMSPFLADCGLTELSQEALILELECKQGLLMESRFNEWFSRINESMKPPDSKV
jgi:signal transduction histidine kinase/CheY-like chemotaxis protein